MWIVLRIMLAFMKNRHRHGRFGLTIELHEDRAKNLNRLTQASHRHRRGAVNNGLQTAKVVLLAGDRIEQHINHGRHHEATGHLMAFDEFAKNPWVKPRVHDERSRLHQHRHDQCPRCMGDGRHGEKTNLLGPVKVGHLHQGHRDVNPVGMDNAFRLAGGPPGIDQHARIVFRGLRLQALRRVGCGLLEDVHLPRPGPEAKQV